MANDLHTPSLPTFSAEEELDQLLLEGLNSGDPAEATPEFWADLRRQASVGFASRQAELRKAS